MILRNVAPAKVWNKYPKEVLGIPHVHCSFAELLLLLSSPGPLYSVA